ncbi:MAG: ATP-binding protein [Proteobacteria bacterium]|nr:ATP-binding protein [Pseudomonadota bacterium]
MRGIRGRFGLVAVVGVIFTFLSSPGALAQDGAGRLTEKQKTESIQVLKDGIVGEDFSIEHLVESLTEENAVTLMMGPAGVGKATLARNAVALLGLSGAEFDLAKENPGLNRLLAQIGTSLAQGETNTFIIDHIENLPGNEQDLLASVLDTRTLNLTFNTGPKGKPKKVAVDLSKVRFILITDQGESLFRNPVGFRTQATRYPDSDQYLAELSDERMRRSLAGWTITEPLVASAKQLVPVRRLSAEEFKIAIQKTLEQIALTYGESLKKTIMIDRQNDLVELLFKREFRSAVSTYHELNEAVEALFSDEAIQALQSPALRRKKSIVLTWSGESPHFTPVPACDFFAGGGKTKNK